MIKTIFYLLLIGLISCSTNSQEKQVVNQETQGESENKTTLSESIPNYREVILSENALDTFSIPFAEREMLMPLREYYKPYLVDIKIGQQDGPDFTYIDILKNDGKSVAFLKFYFDNKLKLEDIRLIDSIGVDQYEIRVGDPLMKLIALRGKGQIKFDPYHYHIYYSYENSNISYELEGELHTLAIENIEDVILTYDDIKHHTIQSIIWRNNKK